MISFLINISQNTIIGNLCSLTKMCAKNDYIGIRYNESRDQISEMNRPCRPNFFLAAGSRDGRPEWNDATDEQ
jgi:hypothetical protein